MNKLLDSFKIVTSKVNFDINAGATVDPNIPLNDLVPNIIEHIDSGGIGCCLHSAIYLSKLLHDRGIYSELIITIEPTVLPDGSKRNDFRVSVLYFDNDTHKYYVANPVEDAETFTREGIPTEQRFGHYVDDTGVIDLGKENICSFDASRIEFFDFVNRYGDGEVYQLGNLFGEDKDVLSLQDLMKRSSLVDLDDLSELDERFGVSYKV